MTLYIIITHLTLNQLCSGIAKESMYTDSIKPFLQTLENITFIYLQYMHGILGNRARSWRPDISLVYDRENIFLFTFYVLNPLVGSV